MSAAQKASVLHVAHVVHRFAMGGMENGVVNLVNRLDPARYRHTIIAMTEVTDFRQRITAANVDLVALEKRPGRDFGAYWRLLKCLRAARPAIIHTRNIGTLDTVFVSRLAGVPVRVHGEHGWDMHDLDGRSRKYRFIRRLCAPFVKRFVAVSIDLKAWLERSIGLAGDRVTHIVNGVDCERFRPGRADAIRRSLGLGDDALVVGTVGRLEAVKGQELLLRAWPLVEERLPKASRALRLVLVGDGSRRAALEALARELGIADRVIFAGARADVPEALRAFDVFVLPSLNEGISNTILEAMACGLPVVATRVGGNPELIDEGVTGRLVAPTDPAALADAIVAIAADEATRQRMAQAAREQAVQRFSLEVMVRRYDTLYAEVSA